MGQGDWSDAANPGGEGNRRKWGEVGGFYTPEHGPIMDEWVSFARTRTPASEGMTRLALEDHIVEILIFIADDLESPQTKSEQVAKSRGLGTDDNPLTMTAAQVHAELRLTDGFDIDQMVSQYRALRASVVKLWVARHPTLAATDLNDLMRFNEAVDQAMTESIPQYTKMITRSRNILLGVLGHDLRNPLGAASMAAERLVRTGDPEERQTMLASEIEARIDNPGRPSRPDTFSLRTGNSRYKKALRSWRYGPEDCPGDEVDFR